jgi:hypothetical protein
MMNSLCIITSWFDCLQAGLTSVRRAPHSGNIMLLSFCFYRLDSKCVVSIHMFHLQFIFSSIVIFILWFKSSLLHWIRDKLRVHCSFDCTHNSYISSTILCITCLFPFPISNLCSRILYSHFIMCWIVAYKLSSLTHFQCC